MTISPVADIQNRIAAIQAMGGRATSSAPSVGGVLGGGSVAAPSGSTGDFAADLQRASSQHVPLGTGAAAPRTGTTSGAAVTGAAVVTTAKEYLGVPYRWGGKQAATGLDCSGLTSLVFRRLGIDLPAGSANQAHVGRAVGSLADARPGDLLFFGRPTDHVAIYAGDGKMVHAPRTGKAVEAVEVYETPSGIRRVLPDSAGGTAQQVAPGAAPEAAAGARSAALVAPLERYSGALPAGTPFAALFRAAEAKTGVPARVLAAVARAESGFRTDAVSPAGARGLMQFMPATARGMGVDPMNPASAIDGAARLLKRHVNEFGSLELALAAYNAGQGTVRRYGGIPPYAETRAYVRKIVSTLNGSAS